MSDASEVKRYILDSTPFFLVGESTPEPTTCIVLGRDHDRIMAERDELWKRATKFVMPGEMDTGESIEHYIKTLEQTVATQAKVIEKLMEQINELTMDEIADKYELAAIEQGEGT